MTLKYYESMCNCLSLSPKKSAARQKRRLSQWSRDFCFRKNVDVWQAAEIKRRHILMTTRLSLIIATKGAARKQRRTKAVDVAFALNLTIIWEKVFDEFSLHSSFILSAKYVQAGLGAYFRKKTISEEFIRCQPVFSKCRRWKCDDVKPPNSVWWRVGCFDFPPNEVWTIFHGSSLLRSSSGIYSRHLQSPRKSPAYTHLQCEDS